MLRTCMQHATHSSRRSRSQLSEGRPRSGRCCLVHLLFVFLARSNHNLSAKYGSYAPFTLVLGGQTMHVVGNPPDVKAVYRLSKALSFEPITVDFVALFGMSMSKRLRDAFPVEDMAGLHHS